MRGGQIMQFTPEDDEIDRKCTFWEGGKVTNNFWMWYQMIQRQYLDFEGGGVKIPPSKLGSGGRGMAVGGL